MTYDPITASAATYFVVPPFKSENAVFKSVVVFKDESPNWVETSQALIEADCASIEGLDATVGMVASEAVANSATAVCT